MSTHPVSDVCDDSIGKVGLDVICDDVLRDLLITGFMQNPTLVLVCKRWHRLIMDKILVKPVRISISKRDDMEVVHPSCHHVNGYAHGWTDWYQCYPEEWQYRDFIRDGITVRRQHRNHADGPVTKIRELTDGGVISYYSVERNPDVLHSSYYDHGHLDEITIDVGASECPIRQLGTDWLNYNIFEGRDSSILAWSATGKLFVLHYLDIDVTVYYRGEVVLTACVNDPNRRTSTVPTTERQHTLLNNLHYLPHDNGIRTELLSWLEPLVQ